MFKLFSKYQTLLIILFAILLALYIRRGVLFFESIDVRDAFDPWYNYIIQNGKFEALGDNFSNYNPPYLYLLVFISYLLPNAPNIVAIKLVSIFFDFVGAFWVYKLVRLKYPKGRKPLYALITVLFVPTVFTNSSYWGQCDMIYTTFLLAFIYFSALKKQIPAFVSFSIAFAFKFQALFLAPVLLILLVKRHLDWKKLFWIPLVYLVGLFPSVLAGRSWEGLLLVYLNQSVTFKGLTMGAPNIYQWVPNRFYSTSLVFALLAIITIALVIMLVFAYRKNFTIDRDLLIQLALFFALIMPYVLPKMHDRYFFPADLFSIVYGFYFPSLSFVPIIVLTSSFFSYLPFLTGKTLIAMKALSLVLAIPIGVVTWKLYRDIENGNQRKSNDILSIDK